MNFILPGMLLTTYYRKSIYLNFLQLVMASLPFTHSVNIGGSSSVGSDLPLVFCFFFTCLRSLLVRVMLSILTDSSKSMPEQT